MYRALNMLLNICKALNLSKLLNTVFHIINWLCMLLPIMAMRAYAV